MSSADMVDSCEMPEARMSSIHSFDLETAVIHEMLNLYLTSFTIHTQYRPRSFFETAFRPCTPLLFDLYHYLEQNGYFGLVPGKPILSEPGSILVDGLDTCRIP